MIGHPECRRCSECVGQDHHWIENCTVDERDPEYCCKHCPAHCRATDDDDEDPNSHFAPDGEVLYVVKAALTADELSSLHYVSIVMEQCHVEQALPADIREVASRGMDVVDRLLAGESDETTSEAES